MTQRGKAQIGVAVVVGVDGFAGSSEVPSLDGRRGALKIGQPGILPR
jgi:hypothetical protein